MLDIYVTFLKFYYTFDCIVPSQNYVGLLEKSRPPEDKCGCKENPTIISTSKDSKCTSYTGPFVSLNISMT
jgi:hypothetical protein